MSPSVEVRCGVREIRRLLEERTADARTLDAAGFRAWLSARLERWEADPVFAQRARIRDLRRAHPALAALEAEERRARAADEASPHFARLRAVGKEGEDAGKAVDGLGAALERAGSDEEEARLREKRERFEARWTAARDEEAALTTESEPRREWLRVTGALHQMRTETGLDREEARLMEMLKERGRRSGRAGSSFEDVALAAVERRVVPELELEFDGERGAGERPVRILRGVTLGAARTEIDLLVIRAPVDPADPAEVLALVEAKRNLNDLGHGFRQRQENLAWLTGDEGGYDPAAYRTRSFPSGRFDRPAVHEEGGGRHVLTRDSFRRFRRDPASGHFLDRLHFVTRPGPVWGVSGAALARIAHRVSTDERWEPERDPYLDRLLRWCRALADEIETPDVLRLYAGTEARACQLLLVTTGA